MRHSVKNSASCLAHCETHYTESRSGLIKLYSCFIYHKEMITTSMTFAAPSLQLRSNTLFHSYEFDWQKASFKQVFEIILSNRNFLLKRRYPFVLCHNGWHFKYWRCKNGSLCDVLVLMCLLFFTQIIRHDAFWQYYNYFQRAYFALITALCLKWGYHFNFHFSLDWIKKFAKCCAFFFILTSFLIFSLNLV